MQKEKMIEKLAAVKALAERGVGGEKETALRMYSDLKEKYGITDAEIATVGTPQVEEVKQEFSDIAFAMWVLVGNLQEEKDFCMDCPCAGDHCLNCSTYENIKDIEKQYEDLTRHFESECAG